jgi:hypothetical protein
VRDWRLWTVPRDGGAANLIQGDYPSVDERPVWGGVPASRRAVPAALEALQLRYVRALISKDLTGDGRPEIVVACQGDFNHGMAGAILPGREVRAFCFGRFEVLEEFALGDVNRDGLPEVMTEVATNGSQGDGTSTIHRWNARTGTFEQVFYGVGFHACGKLRDFDGDGLVEVLFSECTDISGPEERALSYWTDVYAWNGAKWCLANERFPSVAAEFLRHAAALRRELADRGESGFEALAENEARARGILRRAKRAGARRIR